MTAGWDEVVRGEARGALEEILPVYLQSTAWFGRKEVPILATTMVESIAVPVHKQRAYLTLVRVQYAEGEAQLYTLPLAYATGAEAERLCATAAHAVIARLLRRGAAHHDAGYLYDPMWSAPFTEGAAPRHGWTPTLERPAWRARDRHARAAHVSGRRATRADPATIEVDHNNTSVVYGAST